MGKLRTDLILARWLDLVAKEEVLSGSREALESELSGWLELLEAASAPGPSRHELDKLVAFHARSQGLENLPASATALRVHLLEDAARDVHGELPPELHSQLKWMLRVAADAHALGQAEHLENRHHREIRDFSPLLRLDDDTVVAFMLGPMTPELIDAVTGRLLRDCAATGATTAVLDVLGAQPDDDRFHRTIVALLESDVGRRLKLVLSGLRDVEGTRAALGRLGADLARLELVESASTFLVARSETQKAE
ncbi:MAG: hypothetical protein IT384_21815 [Deltaproteobacteria bacterium]|nr:hypothetical protein [Deltaproteobacteria bacterium]